MLPTMTTAIFFKFDDINFGVKIMPSFSSEENNILVMKHSNNVRNIYKFNYNIYRSINQKSKMEKVLCIHMIYQQHIFV